MPNVKNYKDCLKIKDAKFNELSEKLSELGFAYELKDSGFYFYYLDYKFYIQTTVLSRINAVLFKLFNITFDINCYPHDKLIFLSESNIVANNVEGSFLVHKESSYAGLSNETFSGLVINEITLFIRGNETEVIKGIKFFND